MGEAVYIYVGPPTGPRPALHRCTALEAHHHDITSCEVLKIRQRRSTAHYINSMKSTAYYSKDTDMKSTIFIKNARNTVDLYSVSVKAKGRCIKKTTTHSSTTKLIPTSSLNYVNSVKQSVKQLPIPLTK